MATAQMALFTNTPEMQISSSINTQGEPDAPGQGVGGTWNVAFELESQGQPGAEGGVLLGSSSPAPVSCPECQPDTGSSGCEVIP